VSKSNLLIPLVRSNITLQNAVEVFRFMKLHCTRTIIALILALCGSIMASDPAIPLNNGSPPPTYSRMQESPPDGVIEILTLDIKPGRRNEFHKVYETQSLPLLKKWGFKVLAYGPSLHDANSYYVIRSFKSLEDREKSEDAFYNSDDWKRGPRTAIFDLVEHFAYTVVTPDTLEKLLGALNATEAEQPKADR
jgi:hypothetical protein